MFDSDCSRYEYLDRGGMYTNLASRYRHSSRNLKRDLEEALARVTEEEHKRSPYAFMIPKLFDQAINAMDDLDMTGRDFSENYCALTLVTDIFIRIDRGKILAYFFVTLST